MFPLGISIQIAILITMIISLDCSRSKHILKVSLLTKTKDLLLSASANLFSFPILCAAQMITPKGKQSTLHAFFFERSTLHALHWTSFVSSGITVLELLHEIIQYKPLNTDIGETLISCTEKKRVTTEYTGFMFEQGIYKPITL